VKLNDQPAGMIGQRYGDKNTATEITFVRVIDNVCTGLVRCKLQIVADRLTVSYILDAC
jgi:hypothetical protein